jgi:predicted MPP superfamily phosphohydrolase
VEQWKFQAGRRRVLNTARLAVAAAPALAVGYGVWIGRSRFRTVEVEVPVKGLPEDLDGLQMVQLTDIHLGPYLGKRELERAVAMANETRADIALVTGDLITMRREALESCFEELRRLRADAGVWGCLGNHEIVGECEEEAARRAAAVGIRLLRNERVGLRFGNATLNMAGVDYQEMRKPYLRGCQRLVEPGAYNVLLSHNPDVFPVAASQGFDLTIAGHTHGGQVTVEILNQHINAARFFTPYVYGLYKKDGRRVWVSRGLGTVGVPARIGAPPEVALIRLCAT